MKISKLNFPAEELAAFSNACHEYGLDPDLINIGAIGDHIAAGAGMISRTVQVFFNGIAVEYEGLNWIQEFRIDLQAGKWSSQSQR